MKVSPKVITSIINAINRGDITKVKHEGESYFFTRNGTVIRQKDYAILNLSENNDLYRALQEKASEYFSMKDEKEKQNNNILNISQDEYTDEFRQLHKKSIGLLPETISRFRRGSRGLTSDEQKRLGGIFQRLLSRRGSTRQGKWINLKDSKHGNTFNIT